MKINYSWRGLCLVSLFAAFLYFFGSDRISLTDPDETFYAATAQEMGLRHSILTPYLFDRPQFEKPPLFYWLVRFSYRIFGVGTAAARLVPAFFAVIGVAATYLFAAFWLSRRCAVYAALILATSMLYFVMARAVLIDTLVSVLVMLGLYFFYQWHQGRGRRSLNLFALCCGLAVLAKGPVGIIIPLLTVVFFYCFTGNLRQGLSSFIFHRWWLVFLAVGLPWYILVGAKYGAEFWNEFIVHDNWHRILYAEHKKLDTWYFYPVMILGGMFPWTPYFLLWDKKKAAALRGPFCFLVSWVLAVLAVFVPAHSKLASYILPLFPALALICAIFFSAALDSKIAAAKRWTIGMLNVAGGVSFAAGPIFLKKAFPFLPSGALFGFFVFSAMLAAAGLLFIRGRQRAAFYVTLCGFWIFTAASSWILPKHFEASFTDSDMPRVVREFHYEGRPILVNKMFARGTRFYTQNPIVVIDSSDNPFWSKHPLTVLNTQDEIVDFFRDKDLVICILGKKYLKRLDDIFAGERLNQVHSGNDLRMVVVSRKI